MYMYIKRLFDFVASLLAIILLCPLMVVCAVLIASESGGGVFFKQTRIGKNCKPFHILKFRSMTANAPMLGPYYTAKDDPRITKVGKFLRKTSIDELPQLFNVLKGDMSLVGPRPDVPAQEKLYTAEQWQERHSVKPGITGWAQINGRSVSTQEERTALDLEYVKRKSFWHDIVIMLKTVRHLSSS